jgi:hypothetical protein
MKTVELSKEDIEVATRKQIEKNRDNLLILEQRVERNKHEQQNEMFILKRKLEICMDRIDILDGKQNGIQENRNG